jgi:hypothetical protein
MLKALAQAAKTLFARLDGQPTSKIRRVYADNKASGSINFTCRVAVSVEW